MKKLSNRKKALLILSSCLVILTTSKVNSKEEVIINENYEIGSYLPFASYGESDIYIGSEEFISQIKDDSSNIYIIDKRYEKDPNMSICESHKIRDIKTLNEVIDVIIEYERLYPSNWNRTRESMLNEWVIHNISYIFNYEKSRTSQVDLNNDDEDKYKLVVLTKILGN